MIRRFANSLYSTQCNKQKRYDSERFLLRCILLSALVLSSCTKNRTHSVSLNNEESGTGVPLNLRMQLPSQVNSLTTYPGTDQENFIESIYILAFRVDDSDPTKEYFDYLAMGSNIQDVENASNKKEFSVTLFKKDYKQRFVALANAHKQVGLLDESDLGRLKEELLAELVFENEEPWHATSSPGFVYLPMWGETASTYVISDSYNLIDDINMLRAVSRLDVLLSSQQAQEDFTFEDVYLYNRYTNGTVVPDFSADTWDANDYRVLKTTMPYGTGTKTRGPLRIPGSTTEASERIVPTFYAFEANVPDLEEPSKATCVVIGGVYKDDARPTYYRVDFYTRDDADNITGFKELLRNHLYRINIVEVNGSGYGTPDEAFEAKSQNMTAEILEWNQGDLSDIIFDNQYMLGVSQSIYYVPKPQAKYELIVTTDYPGGWTATVDEALYPWLKITDNPKGDADVKTTLVFSVEENPNDSERTGWIEITAGRLTHKIEVVQGIKEALSLEIVNSSGESITELYFRCYSGDSPSSVPAQSYTVNWSPSSEAVTVYPIPEASAFDFTYHDNPTAYSSLTSTGSQTYTIQPRAFETTETDEATGRDPFLEKTTTINYFAGQGSEMIARSLTIRQVHNDLLADAEEFYAPDGSIYSFKVRSNCNWTAAVTATSSNPAVATIQTSSGTVNKNPGVDLFFTTVKNDNAEGWIDVTFTYTGEDGISEEKVVRIHVKPAVKAEPGANSYLLKPGGETIAIPVSWANGDGTTRIQPNEKLTAELLWTDHSAGMKPGGAVSGYELSGTGSDALLLVTPGTGKGNAVIAVKNINGVIRWSWHIWVTDYDPETATHYKYNGFEFMNLNLGAVSETHGDKDYMGLYYQWGRKDPFPGASGPSSNTSRIIYDENGSQTSIASKAASSFDSYNLETSIMHPTTFFQQFSSGHWLTNTYADFDNYLWLDSEDKKNHFDPCPTGWKTAPVTPSSGPWYGYYNGITISNYVASAPTSYGDWPLAGSISTSGSLQNVGSYANYWSGSRNTNGYYYWFFKIRGAWDYGQDSESPANGNTVRCVRE